VPKASLRGTPEDLSSEVPQRDASTTSSQRKKPRGIGEIEPFIKQLVLIILLVIGIFNALIHVSLIVFIFIPAYGKSRMEIAVIAINR